MNKKIFFLTVVILLAVSFAVIAAVGSRYTYTYQIMPRGADSDPERAEDWTVTAEDPEIIGISGVRAEGDRLKVDLSALKRGTTYLYIEKQPDGLQCLEKVYVHRFGIITIGTYFGQCTGGFMIPLSILILLLFLYIDRIVKFRLETRENLYRYRNILNLGLIIFMTFLIFELITVILRFRGIDASVASVLSSAEAFAYIVLPIAFVVSVLVSLSNLNLMRKEGVNGHNMLGFLLGLGICLMTVLPEITYGFILRHQVVDIVHEKGVGTHVYSLFENTIFFIVAYLECILLGTVVFGILAARHIPAFDKDYILIHGSQIRADGTLTPLLQARADKAMEFAEMQRKAAGREITFIPSGGKGEDEVVPEAEAIADYLRSKGVPEERILIEDRSLNTYENIRNAMDLIRERGGEDAKAAFSTTNYHVFRAGLIASEMGYRVEGIGSPTKRYFWINAFIREFVATLVSERRRHLKVVAALLLGVIVLVALNYLSIML